MKNYRKTLFACFLGFITQAVTANFLPLLYLMFNRSHGIQFSLLALISSIFFFTQIIVDVICAKFVDRLGHRRCVIASGVFSALGLIGLAFLPDLFSNAYAGIVVCVVFYAVGSGITETLVSPIVEACPFENKSRVMSILHSFYCWGTVGVILFSTLFFAIFGIENYRILTCVFALIPIVNIIMFIDCPIERLTDEGKGMSLKGLFSTPLVWLAIMLMVCAGASELSMAQWASSYVEWALGISKDISDIVGPCLFAVMMGLSRVIYGKFGEKINLVKYMLICGVLALGCYLLVGLSDLMIFGLIGCVVCGFAVGIMWPGSISITSKRLPLGGTALFAILAMAGDVGGALGPYLVGLATEMNGNDLKTGLLYGSVAPCILIILLIILMFCGRKKENDTDVYQMK